MVARRDELIAEATILDAIWQLGAAGTADPWSDPETLAKAVALGILDAPQLKGSAVAPGKIKTRMEQGACRLWDEDTQQVIGERTRLAGGN